jgi:hypothetical protein
MLPDLNYAPTIIRKQLSYSVVALDVRCQLGLPPGAIVCRFCAMVRASVPKTPVNEHRDLGASEQNINAVSSARDRRDVNAKPQAHFVQRRSYAQLTLGISSAGSLHAPTRIGRRRIADRRV